MRRLGLIAAFAALLWVSGAWTRENPVPAGERTFEASRVGFQPINAPGPLSRNDFVRLLLRREGDFRFPLTVNFREWRRADPPDLWDMDLPGVVKIRVKDGELSATGELGAEVLGVDAVFDQPLLVRNDTNGPVDLQAVSELGTNRWRLAEGLNHLSLSLRPRELGKQMLAVKFLAGEESVSPEELLEASLEREIEVVGWGTLELRTDVPARVTVYGADGLAYAPERGTLSKYTWTAGDPFFYSSGEHEIRLPAGAAKVQAVRGFEHSPAYARASIQAERTAGLSLTLGLSFALERNGWWSGDSHIHANYNDHEFITPEDVLLQTLGEDLNVANLMVANSSGAQIHDARYFEGKPHKLSRERYVLRWIEEMRNAGTYGHMCLPGIERLIHPLYTGFRGTPQPNDYPPNYFQAKAAQEAGGVASYAHPGYRFTDDPFTMSARELPVDLALGVVEAMDVLSNSNEAAALPYWYKLLNTGLKCAISGGSDSFTNRRHHWLPGGQRVYVHTGRPLDYREWVQGYRQGRSFATNGPLLEFTVNGELAGAELEVSAGESVEVQAAVVSLVSLDALEIVVNGEVVASAAGPARELHLSERITLREGSWIAARARGPYDRLLVNDDNAFAHSSPVYCLVDRRGPRNAADARFFVGWIDRLIARVEDSDKFANEGQRRETVELFRKAQEFYR